jgi:inosine-uridine nucleoside N-ribohydrolase
MRDSGILQQGIELFLHTLEQSKVPVDVISFGSARVLAVAFNRNPDLLRKKIARIHISAGMAAPDWRQGKDQGANMIPGGEWNVALDLHAFIRIMGSGLPIALYPCAGIDGGFVKDVNNTYWRMPSLSFLKNIDPRLQRYIDYAFTKKQRVDFLRAMDITEPFIPDTAAYPRPFHFWETDIWKNVAGLRLVRTKEGVYLFRTGDKTIPGDEPIPSSLAPVKLNMRKDGRFTFHQTTEPSSIHIYYRADPDLEERALRQAYPLLLTSFKTRVTAAQHTKPLSVIFETDMGNDVDDVLALDMLYKFVDQGRIRLLGISSNKDNPYSVPLLRIMNNWYGHPAIPLGKVRDGVNSTADAKDYAHSVYDYQRNGEYVFRKYLGDSSRIMESVTLYRKLLSGQADASVSIVSVGFSTNIARLLDSKPDGYSPLTGRELVKKKVKMLYLMAGNFNGKLQGGEYNVIKDSLAAKKVFDEWPTSLVTSPFEVGITVLYPASSIENDLNWADAHPLKVAYESYLPMPYDRPCWDPTAMLYAVEPDSSFFTLSPPGRISVGTKGRTSFTPETGGLHRYLMVDAAQSEKIRNRFIELVKMKPVNFNNIKP